MVELMGINIKHTIIDRRLWLIGMDSSGAAE